MLRHTRCSSCAFRSKKAHFSFPIFLCANSPALISVSFIKSAFAAMPGVGLAQADSAVGLITSTQGPNNGSTAMSLTTASESVTASQVQGALQPQGPLLTAFPINANVEAQSINPNACQSDNCDALVKASRSNDDNPTSSTRMSVGIDGDTTNQNAHFRSAQSIPNVANHPSTTAKPSITTDGLNLQVPNRKTFFADSASASVPFLDINNPLSPTFGTQAQAITANSESQNILPSGFTSSKGSAPTLGFGASIPVLPPQISDTQGFVSSDSLLSHATIMPALSKIPPFLTISGQTVTVNSLGHYSIDSPPLTKGAVTTVSGKMISLASNKSVVIMGTSTEAFGPSATARFGSGSNGTEVQRFSGNALGARDGLWCSSMMFLVFFMVLSWL